MFFQKQKANKQFRQNQPERIYNTGTQCQLAEQLLHEQKSNLPLQRFF